MQKEFRNVAWEILGKLILSPPTPRTIYIEPTNECNLKCPVCPNKVNLFPKGYLNLSLFKKIMEDISEFKESKDIILHKNGEPLLHPQLSEMIRYVRTALPSANISFSTNGLNLKEKIPEQIFRSPPDDIYISYGNILGDVSKKKELKIVEKNTKNFLMLRTKLKKNKPTVTLRFIDKERKFKLIDAKETKWQGLSDKIEIRPYHTWCGYFPKSYRIPRKRVPCLSLWTTLAINWNGDVSICSLDYANKGIIGNIKNASLQEIWESNKLKSFRRNHLEGNYKNLDPCEKCTEWRHNVGFWTEGNVAKAKEYLFKL